MMELTDPIARGEDNTPPQITFLTIARLLRRSALDSVCLGRETMKQRLVRSIIAHEEDRKAYDGIS